MVWTVCRFKRGQKERVVFFFLGGGEGVDASMNTGLEELLLTVLQKELKCFIWNWYLWLSLSIISLKETLCRYCCPKTSMLGWPNVGFDIDFGEKNGLLLKSWLGSFLKFYLILMHLENIQISPQFRFVDFALYVSKGQTLFQH